MKGHYRKKAIVRNNGPDGATLREINEVHFYVEFAPFELITSLSRCKCVCVCVSARVRACVHERKRRAIVL